jgi:hypothetical protein
VLGHASPRPRLAMPRTRGEDVLVALLPEGNFEDAPASTELPSMLEAKLPSPLVEQRWQISEQAGIHHGRGGAPLPFFLGGSTTRPSLSSRAGRRNSRGDARRRPLLPPERRRPPPQCRWSEQGRDALQVGGGATLTTRSGV